MVDEYGFFRDYGVLPRAGGRGEQPARFIASLPELDLAVTEAIRDRDALRAAIAPGAR